MSTTPIQLTATKRTVTGKQVGQLRRSGQLPAVVYGPALGSQAIQLDTRETQRLLRRVHGAQLIDLTVDGQMHKVLLQDLQRDSIRGDFLHVDFYAVDMNRSLRVRLPIHLAGVSFAVTSLSGVLVRGLTDLEIECMPADLIDSVEADMTPLKEIGSVITVKDITVPATIKVLSDPDDMVARVTYQAKEEDLSTPTTATTSEVEVIEKGKIEEEGEEGAAPPAAPAKK
jgi:large subunit ribosomal protein L25